MFIDWFKEGNSSLSIEKHGNELYEIHEWPTDSGLASFMQIRALTQANALLYKCLARNEFGTSERLVKLIVVGAPERPENVRVREVWSRSALISWQPPAPGQSGRPTNYTVQYWRKSLSAPSPQEHYQQQNHRREEITVDGLQSSAMLLNLQPALNYQVSVIAHNQVGQSEPSEQVSVLTSEEEPAGPPTDVQVEPRGVSSVRVSWKPPPIESHNGRLLGFYVGYRPHQTANVVSGLELQPLEHQSSLNAGLLSFKTAEVLDSRQMYFDTFLVNLKPGHEYEVTVRAFNKAGSGPESHSLLVRTNTGRLPISPNLQLQRATSFSITLKWSSNILLGTHQQTGMPRYLLHYRNVAESFWHELEVPMAGVAQEPNTVEDSSGIVRNHGAMTQLLDTTLASELVAPQWSACTLTNLEANSTYLVYVVGASELGLGDPSNMLAVRTTEQQPGVSLSSHVPALAPVDPATANQPYQLPWYQEQSSLWTAISSLGLLVLVLVLASYAVCQYRIRRKYNSSTASSYPVSWTPAGSDTIPSQNSIKRVLEASQLASAAPMQRLRQPPSPNLNGTRTQSHNTNNNNIKTSSHTSRPLLSSHYQLPADLINCARSGSSTLQLQNSLSRCQQHQKPLKTSHSTLNRNQNRQLPPIPYSTLCVKEMQHSSGFTWRQQQQHQSSVEYRVFSKGQVTDARVPNQATLANQNPLIYGVVE